VEEKPKESFLLIGIFSALLFLIVLFFRFVWPYIILRKKKKEGFWTFVYSSLQRVEQELKTKKEKTLKHKKPKKKHGKKS